MPRLVLALLVLLAVAPTASALVVTSPTRVQFGTIDVGDVFETTITVTNKGDDATRVEAAPTTFEGELVTLDPPAFTLAPGESRAVLVRIGLGDNASGGRHDPRLEFIEVPIGGAGAASGRAGLSVPLVFWVDNLKIGNLQADPLVRGAPISARVLVQNFLPGAAAADVVVTLVDSSGAEIARGSARGQLPDANASVSIPVTIAAAALSPGRYLLRATAASDGLVSNAKSLAVQMGAARLTLGAPSATGSGAGTSFAAGARNDGDLPFEGVVTFVLENAEGRRVRFPSAPLSIAPGAAVTATASGEVPPGAWRLRALAVADGVETATDGTAVSIPAPPDADARWWEIPAGPGLALAAAALAAAGAARTRQRRGDRPGP